MNEHLVRVLRESGKNPELLSLGNGTELLVLPYGGRVLGLYAAGDPQNFYWTNPVLRQTESAREFFSSSNWQNTGGDRTWLAPEVDFFFPNFPDLSAYVQPRALDPGDFRLERMKDAIRLVSEFTVTASRFGTPISLRLAKTIGAAANPLRHEPGFRELRDISFAGYSLRTTLEGTGDAPPSYPVSIWSLVQMPHGGEMIFPTFGPAKPRVFFGELSDADFESTPHCLRYNTRASGEQKIGLRAVSSTGRAGYFYKSDEVSQLVVRNTFVNPSGAYVDVPWKAPEDAGYAFQACSVNSVLGHFSELEYHVPAMGGGTGEVRVEDTAQVWAFRGDSTQIATIAEILLGVSL